MHWTQIYDPFGHWWLSTLVAALPILVLFGLLAGLKVKPHLCAIAGALTAAVVAVVFFKMPVTLAAMSFFYGVAFGLLKIAWIVLAAVYLYDISVDVRPVDARSGAPRTAGAGRSASQAPGRRPGRRALPAGHGTGRPAG